MRDTALVLSSLDGHPAVRKGSVGALGYCMGGGYALSAAGTFPERVAVAASFHGGSLATDKPDSPHRLADADASAASTSVRQKSTRASRRNSSNGWNRRLLRLVFVTPSRSIRRRKHGFAVTGHVVYDHESSERHWRRLLEVLKWNRWVYENCSANLVRRLHETRTGNADRDDRDVDGRGRRAGARTGRRTACTTVACDVLGDWGRTYALLIGEAEAMPEDKYGFKPTPAQQSFGERLMHVAGIDLKLVSTLGGKTPAPMVNTKATSKADIVAALRQVNDYGAAVLKEFNDQQLAERVASLPFMGPTAQPAARDQLRHVAQPGHLRSARRLPAAQRHHAAGQQPTVAGTPESNSA